MNDRRQTIIDKIQQRINVEDRGFTSPCHIWTGPTSGEGRGGGYGRMCLNGQTVAVHLVVFTHFHGYIPGKKQIDHLCNQRLCCNTEHLELVTHLRNQRRRVKRQIESIGTKENTVERVTESIPMWSTPSTGICHGMPVRRSSTFRAEFSGNGQEHHHAEHCQ